MSVEPRSRTVASLIIREEECFADFVVESTIRATHGAIPIHQYSRKDGHLVEILEIESGLFSEIFDNRPGFHRDEVEGPHVVKVMTRGTFEAVYGAEQVIEIQSHPIDGAQALSVSPRNLLDTLRHMTSDVGHVTSKKDRLRSSLDHGEEVHLVTEDDAFATVDDDIIMGLDSDEGDEIWNQMMTSVEHA